ncbi:FecR family protein [Odoribacter sp. AF15-53]|uniref:FecR family protein n=1 Tax=Odoribacter sp. AF15-53 TaxID=2292236 RepID=UPI000E4AEC7C|nr:FecR family protein [Odoribacter sp. AF15-53]RHR77736.1 FecR family protein [Odoribacter sp. AF15-53]
MNRYKEIPTLLSKVLLGGLSKEEEVRLRAWRGKSVENEHLYHEVIKRGFVEKKCQEVSRVNIVDGYMNVIRKRKQHVRSRRIKRVISIAAGILLPVIVVLLWVGTEEEQQVSEQVARVIRHGELKAELVLADGTKRLLGKEMTDSLFSQQGANIWVQDKGLNYLGDTSVVAEVHYNILRIPRGGEYSITLSDGTVVYMNSESELRYPVKFVGNERKVFLSGEAYFDVTSDKDHPFLVELKKSVVKVLGTSFDIRAYEDEDVVMTTLVRGKVAFLSGDKKVILNPGEQGILDQTGEMEKRGVDTYLYTAWKEGVFAFQQERLEEIMKIVSRWYNVNVFWENESQKEVTFTGKMRRYDDFSKIVTMLEMTGNTEFEIKGNNIFIRER